MMLLVSWWVVTVLSLRSHSWKQTTSFRPRFHVATRRGHFCVLSTSSRSTIQLFAGPSSSVQSSLLPLLVEVYSTLGCKYCKKAKATLDEMGVSYLTIDITPESGNADAMVEECVEDGEGKRQEKAVRRRRIEHARSTTVPQIYVIRRSLTSNVADAGDRRVGGIVDADDADERVGGCDDLLREIDQGKFQSRLSVGGGGGGGTMVGLKGNAAAAAAAAASAAVTVLPPPAKVTTPSSFSATTATTTSTSTPHSYLNHLALVTDAQPLSSEGLALVSKRFDALSLSKALQTQVHDHTSYVVSKCGY